MEFDITLTNVCRLVLASVLGAVIGLEREIHGRPAGFRTHLLVSLGSCLFVITSIHFYSTFGNKSGIGPVGTDPARIAAQVVTGIGFLGAGAIMRDRASIRGLTTAACLWIAAAVGMACGVGMYGTATVVTLLGLVSLIALKKVEYRLKRDTYQSIFVWSIDIEGQMARLEEVLVTAGMNIVDVSVEKNRENNEVAFSFEVKKRSDSSVGCLVDTLSGVEGVKKVRYE